MAKLKDRTGEKGVSNEGYSMEIVAYRSSLDLDILVDGKHILTGRGYSEFKRGAVHNPDHNVGTYKPPAVFNDRTGEKCISKEGYSLEVVAYRSASDIDVLVDSKHVCSGRRYGEFQAGTVANPYHRGVYGVGYFGVGEHRSKINYVKTAEYAAWNKMLERCYSEKRLSTLPTYKNCSVCEEWHNFQVFADWYEKEFYTVGSERMDLDKDILVKGNKVYSPETCIYVPQRINVLVVSGHARRGTLPIGVMKTKNKTYKAVMSHLTGGKQVRKHLGTFDTPEEAFLAYKTAKEAYIKQVADEYKDKIPKKLYDALYAYTIEITD